MSQRDSITIRDLSTNCIIGILPHERKTPQPVLADIEMNLDLTQAAVSGDISRTLDYALIAGQVKFILSTGKFELLETAAMAICSWLAAPVPTAHLYFVESVDVRLRKPSALDGNGIPEIRVRRHSRDIKTRSCMSGGVNQDILFASDRVAVVRVYHFGSEKIPGSPDEYPFYKDFSSDPRDFLRLAWKCEA